MTVNATSRLFGSLRAFVEQELSGLGTWNDVTPLDGELAELGPYNRRNPLGRFKEIAAITFRDYEITIKSPQESPPLGLISWQYHHLVDQGPIDQTTWQRLGKFIRDNEAGKSWQATKKCSIARMG